MVEPRKPPRRAGTKESSADAPQPAPPETIEQIVLTLSATTHEVVNVERVDRDGRRHALSEQEYAALAGDDVEELISAAQEAFEAGIAEGLGAEEEQDDVDEDIVLWQLLGRQTTARRAFPGDLRRVLLRRLLLRRLLRRRLAPISPSPAHEQRSKPIAEHARNGSASNA
jgi:hypothetical protein